MEEEGSNIKKVIVIDEDEFNKKKIPVAPPLPNSIITPQTLPTIPEENTTEQQTLQPTENLVNT